MKKIGVILILLNFYYLITAQSIVYTTKNQSFYFDSENVFPEIPLEEQGNKIDKGTIVEYEFGDSYYCFSNTEDFYSELQNKNKQTFLLEDLERDNFKSSIHDILNGSWIASYYYDVYHINNVSELLKNETFWNTEWKTNTGERWQDEIWASYIYFSDNFFIIMTNDGYKRSYLIIEEKINDKRNIFDFKLYLGDKFLTPDYYSNSNFINKIKNQGVYNLKFILDGDYLSLFDEDEKLLMTYAKTADKNKDDELLQKIANNVTINNSNITWPRHADGSCDYDGSKKSSAIQTAKTTTSTNVSLNKTMTVKENLKLRSAEATTSEVLSVMSAGTKVKILELGKAENIDGINSNWVKVEVLSSAKDRDGNPIKAGTIGWCYGGYLTETTEANNFESTDTKEISDIKIEEAPKQEINIGIVCAIIGAVLLLLLVILIFAVRKKKDNP